MAKYITRPNGTEDVTPKTIHKWKTVETIVREAAETFGFSEIRVPTFETTELFQRSVGETTDVVQKEMYSVTAKETVFTLRPEGTAGTIRAMLQNGMLAEALPQKVFYILSCFRHERPQAGRLREFHQFGVECFGTASPAADAEVISLANEVFGFLGVEDIHLEINSIGCPECRKNYHTALKEYFESKKGDLCGTCLERLEKNPMRILDCKSEICQSLVDGAPMMLDYLCDDCRRDMEELMKHLDAMGIKYVVDPSIVRGLDYYTKTAFEFITTKIGAQGTVCGGGRYDHLIEEVGGPDMPGVGFGLGKERLLMMMDLAGEQYGTDPAPQLFVAWIGEEAREYAIGLVHELRNQGIRVELDTKERNLKGQMKYSNKLGAEYTVVIGDDEVASGELTLKNMKDGEQKKVRREELINAL